MNLLPIFRATDADPRESVRRNNEMFNETFDLLQKGNIIIIFPEAVSVTEKRVRPVKKGTARMAVDMFKRSNREMELSVLPVGMNYTSFNGPRKDVMINFGDPISMQDRKEELDQHEAKFVNALTKEIEVQLKNLMVISNKEKDDETDQILTIHRMNTPLPALVQFDRSSMQFNKEKAAGDALLSDNDNEIFRVAESYVEKRNSLGLVEFPRYSSSQIAGQSLYFILTIIPSIIAIALHGWTVLYAHKNTPKRIKKAQFFDSVYIGSILVGVYVCALVFFPISFVLYSWGGVLIYWTLRWFIPMYYQNVEYIKTVRAKLKWEKIGKTRPTDFHELIDYRQKLLSALPSDN